MRLYFDTNVIVAALIRSHTHHHLAKPALQRVLLAEDMGIVSSHGLAEMFSVLTRTPFIPKLTPALAWELISTTVLAHFETEELSVKEYKAALDICARRGWSGGLVFDALHVEAARKASCERLLTFNIKNFQALTGANDWVVAPV